MLLFNHRTESIFTFTHPLNLKPGKILLNSELRFKPQSNWEMGTREIGLGIWILLDNLLWEESEHTRHDASVRRHNLSLHASAGHTGWHWQEPHPPQHTMLQRKHRVAKYLILQQTFWVQIKSQSHVACWKHSASSVDSDNAAMKWQCLKSSCCSLNTRTHDVLQAGSKLHYQRDISSSLSQILTNILMFWYYVCVTESLLCR